MSTSNKIRTPFLCFLAIMLPVSMAAGQTATAGTALKWNFQKGQKFNLVVTNEMDQQQDVAGQQMGSKIGMKMKISLEVIDVSDSGEFQLQQTIDDVAISATAQTPMGELKFDSESEEPAQGMASMLAQQLKPMLDLEGVSLVQRIAANGESLGVEFPEGQEAPKGMMGEMSAENVQQMMAQVTMPLPMEEVEPGKEWVNEMETEVPQMGKVNVTRTYRFEGDGEFNSKPAAVIALKAESEFGDAQENAMGMKIDVKDQTVEGKLYFDADAGYMIGSESTQKMTATIEAMGQVIEQVQTVKSTSQMSPA